MSYTILENGKINGNFSHFADFAKWENKWEKLGEIPIFIPIPAFSPIFCKVYLVRHSPCRDYGVKFFVVGEGDFGPLVAQILARTPEVMQQGPKSEKYQKDQLG